MLPALAMAGCGGLPTAPEQARTEVPASTPKTASKPTTLPVLPRAGSGRGGYYQDDGPGDNPPEGLMDVPDAEPRIEPYRAANARPYTVFGVTYVPQMEEKPFKQRGIGSWYGKKFHGQKTASGEPYDMYKMTAAHPTLPIPSYARVTNVSNGKQVIVRINDRGPFHAGRIIDLSFTAALKLGYIGSGSGMLEVERLLPEEIARMSNGTPAQAARLQAASQPVAQSAPQPTMQPTMHPTPQPTPQPVPAPALIAVSASAESGRGETMLAMQDQKPVTRPTTSGYYLQLGSFSQAVNAETARHRLQEQHGTFLPGLESVANGAWHKIFSGPYPNRQEAMAAAIKLQQTAGIKSVIVQR